MMTQSVAFDLRVRLKGKIAEKFLALQERFSFEKQTELIRFCIAETYSSYVLGSVQKESFLMKEVKRKNQEFCKTCGAILPDLSLDYCPETYSCGNHLHVLGRPHSASLCAFCNFRPEVEFAVQMRKERWDWDRIRQHLLGDHLDVEVDSIIQAAMLELGEEKQGGVC